MPVEKTPDGAHVKGTKVLVPDLGACGFPDAATRRKDHLEYTGSPQHVEDTLNDIAARIRALPKDHNSLDVRIHNSVDSEVVAYLSGQKAGYKDGSFDFRLGFRVNVHAPLRGKLPPGFQQDGQFVDVTIHC